MKVPPTKEDLTRLQARIATAVEEFRKDLLPHKVLDVSFMGYLGMPNPKDEPRLLDPNAFPKVLVILKLKLLDGGKWKDVISCLFVTKEESALEVLDSSPGHRQFQTPQEVDQFVKKERE